jgi:cellulose synthase/poly-beta-1,6-N-acetylglucosamine synthase-like glycosyltransferase
MVPLEELPFVTIQLPIFNEKYTVERLLHAVTHLDYPGDRLQIQVLDDSTDDTAQLVNRLVQKTSCAV